MRRLHACTSAVVAALISACASTSDEVLPEGITAPTDGIEPSASVNEIRTNSAPTPAPFPKIQFNVQVRLTNNSSSAKTVSYRNACAVRLQLRSMVAGAEKTVYDETTRDCDPGVANLTVDPRTSEILYSGIRFPKSVLGDSLTPGIYRVVAVFSRDGSPISIDAGSYSIPLCDDQGCRPVAAGPGTR